jgi:hypothetical protein
MKADKRNQLAFKTLTWSQTVEKKGADGGVGDI